MVDFYAVRPTKRCLDDIERPFPPLQQLLHTLDHPVVAKAQRVPVEVAAGGGERIRSVRDRVWFKVKAGVYRAAVHRLDSAAQYPAVVSQAGAWWWIGAAGARRDDSGSDFYTLFEAECRRAGRGTGATSSVHLLPDKPDWTGWSPSWQRRPSSASVGQCAG